MKKIFMKLSSKILPVVFSFLLFPIFVSAATVGGACTGTGLGGFICKINNLLASTIPLLLTLAMVYFIWGVVRYVIADGEEAKKKGKGQIIYGIIGLAVIVGMWGLVNILKDTFFTATALDAPTIPESACTLTPPGAGSTLAVYLNYFSCLINKSLIPLVFSLATVMFIWGVVKFFIINADEEAKRAQGKQYMIWGIVALAVMFSIWGLVGVLGSTFGFEVNILPQVSP